MITINTEAYQKAHGRQPKGGLAWIFEIRYPAAHGREIVEMTKMVRYHESYRFALAAAKQHIRRDLKSLEGTIIVCWGIQP